MIIHNLKPIHDLKYQFNHDPTVVQNLKQNELKKRLAKLKGQEYILKDYNPNDSTVSSHCLSEFDPEIDEIKFKVDHSSASCKFSEIQSIIFGGMSSRFWMLRKHINSLNNE